MDADADLGPVEEEEDIWLPRTENVVFRSEGYVAEFAQAGPGADCLSSCGPRRRRGGVISIECPYQYVRCSGTVEIQASGLDDDGSPVLMGTCARCGRVTTVVPGVDQDALPLGLDGDDLGTLGRVNE